jgi:antitoxin VapB
MSLNIKDPEAHKLAELVAKETGETLTAAVTQALRERLERVRRRNRRAVILEKIHAISARSAALLKGPRIDHAGLLYDEKGLPK